MWHVILYSGLRKDVGERHAAADAQTLITFGCIHVHPTRPTRQKCTHQHIPTKTTKIKRQRERERDLTNSHLKLCFTPPFSDFDPKVVFFFLHVAIGVCLQMVYHSGWFNSDGDEPSSLGLCPISDKPIRFPHVTAGSAPQDMYLHFRWRFDSGLGKCSSSILALWKRWASEWTSQTTGEAKRREWAGRCGRWHPKVVVDILARGSQRL